MFLVILVGLIFPFPVAVYCLILAMLNRRPHPVQKAHFLKIGFNELGQCAAVVCRRWEGS